VGSGGANLARLLCPRSGIGGPANRRETRAGCCDFAPRILRSLPGAVRLGDEFDPVRSELDFVVDFEPLPEGAYANTYFGLIAALERIFERPVDLRDRPSISRAS